MVYLSNIYVIKVYYYLFEIGVHVLKVFSNYKQKYVLGGDIVGLHVGKNTILPFSCTQCNFHCRHPCLYRYVHCG